MQFSNNKLTRDELLSRFFPRYSPVAALTEKGLSGGSCIISDGVQRRVLRQPHDPQAPLSHFLRQYHALCRLPATLSPAPVFFSPRWMVVEYCAGEVKSALPECLSLAGLLYHLHQQSRFGWRIALAPLLELYWQQSDPAGARLSGYAGINVCCASGSRNRCVWRRCIWTSMPVILFIVTPVCG